MCALHFSVLRAATRLSGGEATPKLGLAALHVLHLAAQRGDVGLGLGGVLFFIGGIGFR